MIEQDTDRNGYIPTSVEALLVGQSEQFRHVLDIQQKIKDSCPEAANPLQYEIDNYIVFMGAAAQEGASEDPEVRYFADGTPHQRTYMELLRLISAAGEDFSANNRSLDELTPFHFMYALLYEKAAASALTDRYSRKPHILTQDLRNSATHMRIIHIDQHRQSAPDQSYRHRLEEELIVPLALDAHASRVVHPSIARAFGHPEAITVLAQTLQGSDTADDLPNIL